MKEYYDKDISLIQEALNQLHTDFNMFADGDWTPDSDSMQCSHDNVEKIAKLLDLDLEDLRED